MRAPVIRPLAIGIGVVHIQREAPAFAGRSPLQHLQVAIGIAESGDRTAADMLVDGHRLALLVIDEIEFGKTRQDRYTVTHLEFGLDAATDDLFGRNAVNGFGPGTHELDTAARNDIRPVAIGAQITKHFQHRLIDHLGIAAPGFRMLGGSHPVPDDGIELLGGHSRMGGHRHFHQGMLATGKGGFHVAAQDRCKGFFGLPFRMLRGQRLDAVEDEERLEIHRLFRPERAVVVEYRNTFGSRHEIRTAFAGRALDEIDNGFFGGTVLPRRQRIGGLQWRTKQGASGQCGDGKDTAEHAHRTTPVVWMKKTGRSCA